MSDNVSMTEPTGPPSIEILREWVQYAQHHLLNFLSQTEISNFFSDEDRERGKQQIIDGVQQIADIRRRLDENQDIVARIEAVKSYTVDMKELIPYLSDVRMLYFSNMDMQLVKAYILFGKDRARAYIDSIGYNTHDAPGRRDPLGHELPVLTEAGPTNTYYLAIEAANRELDNDIFQRDRERERAKEIEANMAKRFGGKEAHGGARKRKQSRRRKNKSRSRKNRRQTRQRS